MLLVYGAGAVLGPLAAGLIMHPLGPGGLFVYMAGVLGLFVLFALLRMRVTSPVPSEERSTYLPVNRTSPAAAQLDPRTMTDPDPVEVNGPGTCGDPHNTHKENRF